MNKHALEVLEYPQIVDLLAGFATSGLGQERVRRLVPLSDVAEVARLQAETTELKTLLMPEQDLPIGGLHDLSFILLKLAKGTDALPIDEILLVADTLRAARNVRAYLEEADETIYPHLVRLVAGIAIFPELEARIDKTFNEQGAMRSSASPRLKSLRNEIQTLRGRIRGKLTTLMRSSGLAPYLQDTGIRESDGRPALAIQSHHAAKVSGVQRGRSDTGSTVFVEPEGIRAMGDELEGAVDAEKAEQLRILRELTARIAEPVKELRQTLDTMAHVDMTFAKVRMSRAFEMQPPRLDTQGRIRLREARHPLLLDLMHRGGLEEVVPINVRLGDDFHTLIITGPNTGGKTITLKTIGLLTLMAQAGMHVPAADSTLAVFDGVWADIGDEQSIEQSLSTFSSHLTQIGQILAAAGEQSLVLLDELGGGTDPAEGAALARAILDYLHRRGTRTAITTHISQLKMLGYAVAGMENASIEFDMESLKPTHRVLIGTPGSSNALALARRLGLPGEVLDRAEENPGADGATELLNELQGARVRALKDREEAMQLREEAQAQAGETQRKLAEVQAQVELLKFENGQAAYAALRELARKLEELIQREPSKRSLLQALGELGAVIARELERAPAPEISRPFKPGDRVHVRSLGKVGVLNQVDTRANKAVVDFGSLPMTVALEDVESA
ncbi:MAG: MutS2/Smr-associated SH3 domain-containing protein [Candidatus Latescibacterota bacterium]|nr:MutS2/Smr-associated SH3 domain-containing protein [Candidatus Latescibacterota bacterium]